MKNSLFDSFLEEAHRTNFQVKANNFADSSFKLDNDALFHLPFIAVAILVMAKDRRYGSLVGEVGHLIGITFERTFPAFKRSEQMLGWSANLRGRTARAIVFLELFELISVDSTKKINLTEKGRGFINGVMKLESNLGVASRSIARHYRNIKDESPSLELI